MSIRCSYIPSYFSFIVGLVCLLGATTPKCIIRSLPALSQIPSITTATQTHRSQVALNNEHSEKHRPPFFAVVNELKIVELYPSLIKTKKQSHFDPKIILCIKTFSTKYEILCWYCYCLGLLSRLSVAIHAPSFLFLGPLGTVVSTTTIPYELISEVHLLHQEL